MKNMRSIVGAGVLALALVVTGCSAGGEGGMKPTVNSSKGVTETGALPSTAWTVADYAQVKDGGQLTVAVDQLPDNWNVLQAGGASFSSAQIIDPTSGGPIRIKSDGSWEVNPDYATEVTLASEDPQVIEIKLNPKSVWEDGSPITYKDYDATIKANNGSDAKFQAAGNSVYQDIASVTREDSDTNFKITFKHKNADWASILGGQGSIIPAAIASNADAFNEGYTAKPLPSSGPYIASKIDAPGQVVTLTPNPKWWGEKPKLDKIIMKVVSRDQLAQAYANKEIDAINIGTSKDNYDTAKKRADGAIQQSGGVGWSHITINSATGPLADVKVRQAVAHALDRDTISASRLAPIGAPVTNMNSYIFMPGQNGYEDHGTAAIGYDVAKSGELLDAAGYAKGADGMRTKDGKALELTYTLDANNPVSAQIFKQVQANLRTVGISLKNSTVPADKFISDYIMKSNFELTSFSWAGTAFPISAAESIFYPIKSGRNFTGIADEKLGAMWQEANAELDPAKRIKLANAIDKEIFSYVPIIPLTTSPFTFGVKKGLANYGAAQFQSIDWTTVGWTSAS